MRGGEGWQLKNLRVFSGNDWQEKAGYTVSYEGDGFVYDAERKVLINDNVVEETYTVVVTLDQGNGNVASHPYSISVVGSDVAAIDQSTLRIEDITQYINNLPKIQFDAIALEFIDDAYGVVTANVDVIYTSFETKLRVHVEAVSSLCKGEDKDSTSRREDVYQKDYDVKLGKETNAPEQSVEFTIIAENDVSIY